MLEANLFSHFRPIALTNYIFKVIPKILAARLKHIIVKIISSQQHGFISNRSILDAIGFVFDNFQLLDRKIQCGNVAIKLDIEKAFDTFE